MEDSKTLISYAQKFMVKEGSSVSLKDFDTDDSTKPVEKKDGARLLEEGVTQLTDLQSRLYANDRFAALIVIQAMDAAGKDGVVKHVMSGLNPAGVNVHSFKTPTHNELQHDFLWRHQLVLPAKGEVCIFNRSHYENVLVTRVHPEYILNENLPGIKKVEDIPKDFWEKRFKRINQFEKGLIDSGVVILKFYLHISKKEQKKRFLERIETPDKNWKFSAADVAERAHWKDYRKAYEDMLSNTSKEVAPWYVIPADDKWFTRLVIADIISAELKKLDLHYPLLSDTQLKQLQMSKDLLLKEDES